MQTTQQPKTAQRQRNNPHCLIFNLLWAWEIRALNINIPVIMQGLGISILVAYDELDLSPGIAKLKKGGSSSQNGIRDIVKCMGNNKDFHRLRIGIGHPGHKSRVTGYVLGKAPASDQQLMDAAIDEAVRCTDILIKDDMLKAMNRLHSFKAEE